MSQRYQQKLALMRIAKYKWINGDTRGFWDSVRSGINMGLFPSSLLNTGDYYFQRCLKYFGLGRSGYYMAGVRRGVPLNRLREWW